MIELTFLFALFKPQYSIQIIYFLLFFLYINQIEEGKTLAFIIQAMNIYDFTTKIV